MYMRKGTPADIPAIMNIIRQAQQSLAAQGVDQWQDGYPDEAAFLRDMERGYCRVAVESAVADPTEKAEHILGVAAEAATAIETERILGVAAFIPDGEPDYDVIYDGAWLNDGAYMTVHRVAVDGTLRRKGVASFLLGEAVKEARELGLKSLRLDTHRDNKTMQAVLTRNGLTNCGIIVLGRANVSDASGLPEGPLTPDMVPEKYLRLGFEKWI